MTNKAEVAEGSKDADARKVLYLTVIQNYLLHIRDLCIAQIAVVVDIVFGVDKVAERCIGEVCFVDGETGIYNFYNPLRILVKSFISIYVFTRRYCTRTLFCTLHHRQKHYRLLHSLLYLCPRSRRHCRESQQKSKDSFSHSRYCFSEYS